MLIGYSTTFESMDRKIHARLQLNVDNLFDKDTLIFLNYTGYGTNQSHGMDYNMVAPRKITLSASLSF